MILDLDSSMKKKKGAAYFELDEDLDMEWIKEHQAFLAEELRQKIRKKFDKENEKRAADGEKEMKAKELEERLKAADELEAKYKKENKTKKVEAEGRGPTVEKFEGQISKIDQRIENMLLQAEDKENNKEVALGTSKLVSSFFFFIDSILPCFFISFFLLRYPAQILARFVIPREATPSLTPLRNRII